MREPKPHLTWRGWLLIAVVSLVILIGSAYAIFAVGANRKLRRVIADIRERGEPTSFEEIAPLMIVPGPNSATAIRAAIGAATLNADDDKALSRAMQLPWDADERAAATRVVNANAAAFSQLRIARSCPGVDWGIRLTPTTILSPIGEYNGVRNIVSPLSYATLLAHIQNKDRDAVEYSLDSMRLSDATAMIAPTLVSYLVGIGIDSTGHVMLREIAPDLKISDAPNSDAASPAAIQQIINALLDDGRDQKHFDLAMRGEQVFMLNLPRTTASNVALSPLEKFDLARALPRLAVYREAGLAPNFVAMKRIAKDLLVKPPKMISFGQVYLPQYERLLDARFRCQCDRRVTAIVLALAMYRNEHNGDWPTKLDALVPNYLPALPADPFREDGATFGYIAGESLYSVGENGSDEHASTQPATPALARRTLLSDWERMDVVFPLQRPVKPPPEKDE